MPGRIAAALRRPRAGTPSPSTAGPRAAREGPVPPSVGRPNVVVARGGGRHDRSSQASSPRTAPTSSRATCRVALVYAEISGQFFGDVETPPPRPGRQRRHPRAAAGQRRRRPRAHRDAPDRAHVRLVPGRARLRADQARLRPPGRRRRAGRRRAARSTSPAAGRTHQSPGDVALMDTLPGMHIHAPGTADEVDAVLRRAVAGDGLHYVRVVEQTNTDDVPGAGRLPRRTPRSGRDRRRARADARRRARGDRAASTSPCCTPTRSGRSTPPASRDALATPDVVLVEPWLAGTSARVVVRRAARRTAPPAGARRRPRASCAATAHPADHVRAHGLDAAGIRRALTGFLSLAA